MSRWGFAVAAFIVMLASSLVDNMRGPTIPALTRALGISYGDAGMLLVAGQASFSTSALFLFWLLRAFGVRRITIAFLTIGFMASIAAGWVNSFHGLLAFGAALGLMVGCGGTLSSIILIQWTPAATRGRLLAGLHGMYGIGSVVAPMLVSVVWERGLGWAAAFAVTLPLTLAAIAAAWGWIPATSEPGGAAGADESADNPGRGPRRWGMMAFIIALFSVYVGGEVLMSGWLAAWLAGTRGMPVERAALYVTGFFVTLTVTRMSCFAFLKERHERPLLIGVLALGIAVNALGQVWHPAFLMLAGVLGPYYPVLLGRVSRVLPREWRDITVLLGIVCGGILGILYAVIGLAADRWGLDAAYRIPLALQALALGMTLIYFKLERAR